MPEEEEEIEITRIYHQTYLLKYLDLVGVYANKDNIFINMGFADWDPDGKKRKDIITDGFVMSHDMARALIESIQRELEGE